MKRQRGFGAIMAMVLLVALAVLAAAMAKFTAAEQADSALDVLSARALVVARSGVQWGLYQALAPTGIWRNGCSNAARTLDLRTNTGMVVTVTCNAATYGEGGTVATAPLIVFQINAVACNSSTSCPDSAKATSPDYVERQLQTVATSR